MNPDSPGATGGAAAEVGGFPGRLERLPFPALLAGLVVYAGLALGLAAIGGWVGLGAIFFLAALMIAAIVAGT